MIAIKPYHFVVLQGLLECIVVELPVVDLLELARTALQERCGFRQN